MTSVSTLSVHRENECNILGEAMELRIKNTEDELMMVHGGLLMKWIDPDVMTGHNKCCQKRTTIRNM